MRFVGGNSRMTSGHSRCLVRYSQEISVAQTISRLLSCPSLSPSSWMRFGTRCHFLLPMCVWYSFFLQVSSCFGLVCYSLSLINAHTCRVNQTPGVLQYKRRPMFLESVTRSCGWKIQLTYGPQRVSFFHQLLVNDIGIVLTSA